MRNYGLIWVRGGNVFVLRRAYKESGFDEWLKSQKGNDKLVYAGYSAGVCVLSPSLKGLDLVDDPNVVPEGYKPETVWDGVGLLDFAFIPHYRSNHPESERVEKCVAWCVENNVAYKALHDGEAIIYE